MTNNETITAPAAANPVPEKRVWDAWPTLGFGITALVGFFIAQFLIIIVILAVMTFSQAGLESVSGPDEVIQLVEDILQANLGLLQSVATIFSGIIGFGIILIIIRGRKRAGIIEYLGLFEISGNTVLLSIGIVLAYIGLATLLQTFLGIETGDQIMFDVYNTSLWPPLFWISVIIFAPLFEEALFRGFLFEGFLQSRLGPAGAIIITAVAWAILHIQYSISGIIYILVLGIIIGVVRWKTRTLWSSFIMHAVMNLVATISIALSTGA